MIYTCAHKITHYFSNPAILDSLVAKKKAELGQIFEIDKNGYHILICHLQISLHGNFQLSSTIFQIQPFQTHF